MLPSSSDQTLKRRIRVLHDQRGRPRLLHHLPNELVQVYFVQIHQALIHFLRPCIQLGLKERKCGRIHDYQRGCGRLHLP
jgi:hypothetical protein